MPSSARAEPATQTNMAATRKNVLAHRGVVSREKREVWGGRGVERTSRQNYVVLTRCGLPRVTECDIRQGQKLRQLPKSRSRHSFLNHRMHPTGIPGKHDKIVRTRADCDGRNDRRRNRNSSELTRKLNAAPIIDIQCARISRTAGTTRPDAQDPPTSSAELAACGLANRQSSPTATPPAPAAGASSRAGPAWRTAASPTDCRPCRSAWRTGLRCGRSR